MSVKNRVRLGMVVCLIVSWLLLGGRATLAHSTFGGTNLVTLPTSSILPPGGYSVGCHYFKDDWTKIQFEIGLFRGLQVGAVADLAHGEYETGAMLKYQLVPERMGAFGLAIGLEDLGRAQTTSYMVASQTLPQYGLRWHLGVAAGVLDGFFIGANKVFNSIKVVEGKKNPWPRVIVIGEYDTSGLNIGTRIELSGGFFLDLAVLNLDTYTIGISYNKYL
ncbi:MAG TPA: hypothetical protein VIL66_03050 [Bacillota bacterium]